METGAGTNPGSTVPILFGMRAADRWQRIIAGMKELRELRRICSIARSPMKANATSSSSASNIRRLSTIVFEGARGPMPSLEPGSNHKKSGTLFAPARVAAEPMPRRYGGRDRAQLELDLRRALSAYPNEPRHTFRRAHLEEALPRRFPFKRRGRSRSRLKRQGALGTAPSGPASFRHPADVLLRDRRAMGREQLKAHPAGTLYFAATEDAALGGLGQVMSAHRDPVSAALDQLVIATQRARPTRPIARGPQAGEGNALPPVPSRYRRGQPRTSAPGYARASCSQRIGHA